MSDITSTSGRPSNPSGGSNQGRVRDYNERLVLSLVRRHGGLSKSEIARRTGLTVQTVSVIMRALEADGLLLRGEPIRGKVGQPSVPMSLNPVGAYAFGLKVGRRSAELILINFIGEKLDSISIRYPYPLPEKILEFAEHGIAEFSKKLSKKSQTKIAGVGIGVPFQLWQWGTKVGAPEGSMNIWQELSLEDELHARTGLPCFTQNDATAACAAELTFGKGAAYADFVYFLIATFAGGGIVLNHAIYAGRAGNAGALGSMPIMHGDCEKQQLLDYASFYKLEQMLVADGKDPSQLTNDAADWDQLGDVIETWICQTARHIALSIVSACSIIDFQAAIIDGALPAEIRDRLVRKIQKEAETFDFQGIELPEILPGSVGLDARALGAATLPLFNRYLLDHSVLFKEKSHA